MPTGHAKATVGSTVLAEADTWEEVEGNVYFPPSSVKTEFFTKTEHSTHCPWKGDASYYTIKTNGKSWIQPDNSFLNIQLTCVGCQRRSGAAECCVVLSRPEGEGEQYQGLCGVL